MRAHQPFGELNCGSAHERKNKAVPRVVAPSWIGERVKRDGAVMRGGQKY